MKFKLPTALIIVVFGPILAPATADTQTGTDPDVIPAEVAEMAVALRDLSLIHI